MKENTNQKAKYWVGILYPENMIADWQQRLPELVQLPFAYCIHDKCVDSEGNPRKTHVHLMIVFKNTTTYNHALSVFDELSSNGCSCVNTIKRVLVVRNMYNYLIHDTDDCRKKNKRLYDKSERIEGNGFDIGLYEQLSEEEKEQMLNEITIAIIENGLSNFYQAFMFINSNYDIEYVRLFRKYNGFFDRICKGMYLEKYQQLRIADMQQNED